MIARSFPILSPVLSPVLLALAFAPLPALARDGVTPAEVLAAKAAPREAKAASRGAKATSGTSASAKAAADKSFSDRIARIGAIMGSDPGTGARLRIPERPEWTRPRQRAADALAGTR